MIAGSVSAHSKTGALRATLKPAVMPLLLTLVLFAGYVASLAIPGAWLLLAICAAFIPPTLTELGALVLGLSLIMWFWGRHRVSGAAMLAGFIALFIAMSAPNEADSAANWTAHLAQVAVYRNALQRQAAPVEDENKSASLAVLPLDGFGSMTNGIAFDSTGEIMLPPQARSTAWRAAAGRTDLIADGLEVHHVIGDYYAWFHY